MENLFGKKEKKILVFYQKEKNGFGIFFGKNIIFFVDFGKMENKMDLENF